MFRYLILPLLALSPFTVIAQPRPDAAMQVQLQDARLTPAQAGRTGWLSVLIRNPTAETLTLTGITTPVARQVVFQRYDTDAQGYRRLTPLPGLLLAPGADVVVVPGALEVKLLGVTETLERTMEVPLELHFSNGTRRTVRVTIQEGPSHD